MPPRVSTGDRDTVLRQIRWCAAVQTLVNCHCQLEENPAGNVEPVQLVMQYLTQAAIKLPSASNPLHAAAATFDRRDRRMVGQTCYAGSASDDVDADVVTQSCPWVGLTHGLNWVEIFQFFGRLGWVGSTTAKVLKI